MSKDFLSSLLGQIKIMSQILQICVKWRHKRKTRRKHIKCNISTQAYQSICSTETHQVRPELLKGFCIVQQDEVNLLIVAYFWKWWFLISFCHAAHFSTTAQETTKNVDRSCVSFCRSSAKRQVKTSQNVTKLCQLQLSVNKSQMLHEFYTWILFTSSAVNSCSMPFSSFPLPLLFTYKQIGWIKSAIVCCHNNFFETVY